MSSTSSSTSSPQQGSPAGSPDKADRILQLLETIAEWVLSNSSTSKDSEPAQSTQPEPDASPSTIKGKSSSSSTLAAESPSSSDNKDEPKSGPDEPAPPSSGSSASPLFNIGALDLKAEWLQEAYEALEHSTARVSIGTHCSFPKNEGARFSKEDLVHVATLHKHFKVLCSTLHLCIKMASLHGELASSLYRVAITVLYAMWLQLDTCNKIYICCRYGEDTLAHFNILSNSTLVSERRAHLLDTITLASATATNCSRL